jgi:hypothetical protein
MKLTALHHHRLAVLQLGRDVRAGQPAVLVEFQTACANIVSNPQWFPMLGCGKHQRRRLFTSANRERRRERLLMMSRVLSVVGAHADLLTLSDGQRVGGECKPITELQLGRELGIEAAAGDELVHDTTGMRAMRSALRDLGDGGLVSRVQPRTQYCSAGSGGCGRSIPRGGTCKCGRRQAWRWRSHATIITIQKEAFSAMGLLEQLEEQQGQRYADIQAGKVGPEPIVDVRLQRERRKVLRAQHRRTESARGAEQAAQLARLYPDEK